MADDTDKGANVNHTTAADTLAALAGVCAAVSAVLKLYSNLRPAPRRHPRRSKPGA